MEHAHTLRLLWGLGAAALAGALNSVAGGGSFISFPALVFLGLPAIVANATNNTAMWLGSLSSVGGYREEFAARRALVPALAVSLVGGIVGAELLLRTPEATFTRMIPWLLLVATVIFAASDVLRIGGRQIEATDGRVATRWLPALFVVAIYGGYFGAGVGILILALFALAGWTHIHRMNAVKVLLATSINGIAVIPFLIARKIAWEEALIFTIGAVLGGYFGARIARKVEPRIVRFAVVAVGVGMTVFFFVKTA